MEALYSSLDAAMDEIDLGSSVMLPADVVTRHLHSSPPVAAQQVVAAQQGTLAAEPEVREDVKEVASVSGTEKPLSEAGSGLSATSEMPPAEGAGRETAVVAVPSGVPVPPEELRIFADRTAQYVARGGEALERVIAANERDNPIFCFLRSDDAFHAYYRMQLEKARKELPLLDASAADMAVSGDYRMDLSRDVMMVSGGRFAPVKVEEERKKDEGEKREVEETVEKKSKEEDATVALELKQEEEAVKSEWVDVAPEESNPVATEKAAVGEPFDGSRSSSSDSASSVVAPRKGVTFADEKKVAPSLSRSSSGSSVAEPAKNNNNGNNNNMVAVMVDGEAMQVDEDGWQVLPAELMTDIIAGRSGEYEAVYQAEQPVKVKYHEAAAIMNSWCESDTWRQSAMQNNEWTQLPTLVLDKIFRDKLGVWNLKNCALVCRKWSEAATKKIPYSKELFDNDRNLRRAQREQLRQQQRQERLNKFKDIRRGVLTFLFMLIPAALCFMIGLTGILYFHDLIQSVSIVPECPAAYSMAASLYACCGFWLADFVLFFLWSLTGFNHNPWGPGPAWRRKFTIEKIFVYCNAVGVLANIGIWTSAAACVHFCNSCIDSYPLVSSAVRSFAGFSLAFGLAINLLGIWFQAIL